MNVAVTLTWLWKLIESDLVSHGCRSCHPNPFDCCSSFCASLVASRCVSLWSRFKSLSHGKGGLRHSKDDKSEKAAHFRHEHYCKWLYDIHHDLTTSMVPAFRNIVITVTVDCGLKTGRPEQTGKEVCDCNMSCCMFTVRPRPPRPCLPQPTHPLRATSSRPRRRTAPVTPPTTSLLPENPPPPPQTTRHRP